MKKIKFRHSNGVDLNSTFSAKILGSSRGFGDKCAMESFSNDVTPTIKCVMGFTVLVEVENVQT